MHCEVCWGSHLQGGSSKFCNKTDKSLCGTKEKSVLLYNISLFSICNGSCIPDCSAGFLLFAAEDTRGEFQQKIAELAKETKKVSWFKQTKSSEQWISLNPVCLSVWVMIFCIGLGSYCWSKVQWWHHTCLIKFSYVVNDPSFLMSDRHVTYCGNNA